MLSVRCLDGLVEFWDSWVRARSMASNIVSIFTKDGDTGDWALGSGSERDFIAILLVVHVCFNYNHTRVLDMFSEGH